MPTRIKTGSLEQRRSVNRDTDRERIVTTGAVTTALNPKKGLTVLAPTGNTTGATLAAPTVAQIGQRKKIVNTTAFSFVLTISGMAFATQDVFTFVAAAAGVVGPSIELEVINVAADGAAPVAKWQVMAAAGFVAGTSAVA